MIAEPDRAKRRSAAVEAAGSSDPLAEIRAAAGILRGISEQLRDPEVSDARAAELAREAAEVVSRAGNEIDRALSEPDGDEG